MGRDGPNTEGSQVESDLESGQSWTEAATITTVLSNPKSGRHLADAHFGNQDEQGQQTRAKPIWSAVARFKKRRARPRCDFAFGTLAYAFPVSRGSKHVFIKKACIIVVS